MQKPNGVPILIRRTHEERILAVRRDNGGGLVEVAPSMAAGAAVIRDPA